MTIAYNFTVLSVDGPTKSMLVRFESDGRQAVEVSVPLPNEGQALADVVATRVPVYLWEEQDRNVAQVVPGANGSGETAPTVLVVAGLPFAQFYGLFSNAEKTALIAATQTDVQAKRRYDELMLIGLVSVALPEVEMLLARLVSLNALTVERKAAILVAMQ